MNDRATCKVCGCDVDHCICGKVEDNLDIPEYEVRL